MIKIRIQDSMQSKKMDLTYKGIESDLSALDWHTLHISMQNTEKLQCG